MARWTEDEDDMLRALAADGLNAEEVAGAIDGRSASGVYGRARTLGVTFSSRSHQSLREYLSEGGYLLREDIGGAVGVRWAPATRCGGSFNARICERLVVLGVLLPASDSENVYRAAKAA